ncbi:hypothetical protein DFH94DRAFT_747513 [Russula ochroleuca]|uniref:Uncharacterized protein n=1 Tax=Russula ochroleuca TaxID=152965 RepID=A0A9P5MUE3_9AGAM|nr:hypothetical protein DFH94DRAFT_747513 [Russula ochroleuca]
MPPSYLLFSYFLIIPYWLVTFTHVHVACTHPNLSANRHLEEPLLVVIVLLLALFCLNS